jgi:hypothetical protein
MGNSNQLAGLEELFGRRQTGLKSLIINELNIGFLFFAKEPKETMRGF